MPSTIETTATAGMVGLTMASAEPFARFPQLRPRRGADDFRAPCWGAFIRLAHLGRRDDLDTARALSWWVDDSRDWLRQHQIGVTWITDNAFTAAVVAHGDIPFTSLDEYPCGICFGLQFGGGGRASSDRWCAVLATGRLPDPTASPRPKVAQSPVQIVVGWDRAR